MTIAQCPTTFVYGVEGAALERALRGGDDTCSASPHSCPGILDSPSAFAKRL
jgi:hypothetical protein